MNLTPTTAAEALHKDRATIVRACRGLKPVAVKGKVKTYQLADIVDALISTAVAGIAGADNVDTRAFAKERTEKLKQQRLALQRENAIASGKYCTTEEVGVEVERLFSVVRENLMAVSYNIADALVGQLRAAKTPEAATVAARDIVSEAVTDVLTALSGPDEIIEKTKAA
jgi:hypothetical protein